MEVLTLTDEDYEELGIDLSNHDDNATSGKDIADQEAERDRRIADAYRLGDWTLDELAEEWWITKYQVTRIVDRLTTDDERFAAICRRWDANGARRTAENELAGAERARLLRGTDGEVAADESTDLVGGSPIDLDGYGSLYPNEQDESGVPSPADIARLNELALSLADLNPVLDVTDFGGGLIIPFDDSSDVNIDILGGEYSFGASFELADGSGFSEGIGFGPTADLEKAEQMARAALAQMPKLKAEILAT